MKKTAILIYDQFCSFEIGVALELLALAGKPITVFAKTPAVVRIEEGVSVLPDKTIDTLDPGEYDSLLLPGAADIRQAAEDEKTLDFIRLFDDPAFVIGAISIAPVLLLKTGMLTGKKFMVGADREDLLEEGFTEADLSGMTGWSDNLLAPVEAGCIVSGNIVTSVSYNFVRWSLAFGEMIGIRIPPATFGL